MDKKEIGKKLESTAMKLLDCAEKAAERSAARNNPNDTQNVQQVVDSALKILQYHRDNFS